MISRIISVLLLLPLPVLAETKIAETAVAPRPVVTEIIASEATRLREFPGVVVPRVETSLGFLTTGRIETRLVDLGDVVRTGDVIATLDQIALTEEVAAAEAKLRAAQAQATLGAETFARVEELRRRGVAPNSQLEQATANRDATAASVAAAEAELLRARDAAANGTLLSPADGVVVSVEAEPGSVVNAGSSVITLATDSGQEVVIDVPTEVSAFLGTGAKFIIRRREANGGQTDGTLRLIEPVTSATARTHRLRITLAEGSGLRLGSLVSVALEQASDEPVLMVPQAAVMEDGTIWRVGLGRKLEKVAVTLGEAVGARVVVTGGIAIGDEILVRGVHSVSEGQVVGERIAS